MVSGIWSSWCSLSLVVFMQTFSKILSVKSGVLLCLYIVTVNGV